LREHFALHALKYFGEIEAAGIGWSWHSGCAKDTTEGSESASIENAR
jgi:hypothetical protein